MIQAGHILGFGESQAGKTTGFNELHYTFPGPSVLVDTKGGPQGRNLWGQRIYGFDNFRRDLVHADKFVYDPPRVAGGTSVDWPAAHEDLATFWRTMRELTAQNDWRPSPEEPLWWQAILTEGHKWREPFVDRDGRRRPAPPTVDEMIQQMLGFGGRLGFETQYAAGLDPEMRTNFPIRLIWRPGLEGVQVLRQWQWPADEIQRWTDEHRYGFARHTREQGWTFHEARPRGPRT